jgi:Transcriptional regulator, AbiEi antitoxin
MGLVRRIAASQDGMVTLDQARRAGLALHTVEGYVRRGRWRRLAHGAYLVDAEPGVPAPRRARIRAAVTSFGPRAVAVLDTAAELHGIAGLRGTEVVHVAVPGELSRPGRATDSTVVVHQRKLPPGALSTVDRIPTTNPLWTVTDTILVVDHFAAVSVLDSALNQGLLGPAGLAAIPALLRGRRGAVTARRAIGRADARAQSPLETRVRLRCVDGRVPPDVLQIPVRDEDGYLLGVGDLGWLTARVIAEADGAGPHGTLQALFEDRQRQNRIVNAGWVVLRFTWADALRPDYIPYVVRRALVARTC